MNYQEIIKNNKWHLFGRWKHTGMFEDGMLRVTVDGDFQTTVSFVPKYYLVLGNGQFVTEEDYREGVGQVKAQLLSSPDEFRKDFRAMIEKSIAKLDKLKLEEGNVEVIKDYLMTSFNHTRYWFGIMLADGALQEIFPTTLPEKFILLGKEMNRGELLAKAALPKKDFPIILGEINLLKIAIKLENKENIDEDLEYHARQYGWMNSLAWWTEPFTSSHYWQEVEQLSQENPKEKLKLLLEKKNSQHEDAQKILLDLKNNYSEAWLYLDVIRDLTDLKEENWDIISQVGARNRDFFKKIARKYGLSYNQLFMLNIDELLNLLIGGNFPEADELNNRINCYCVLASREEIAHTTGDEAKDLLKLIEGEMPVLDHLQGTVIWQGKETGRVNVLHSVDEVNKMKVGDILVCPMTDPDYMPAIKKAKAIVTNQGGMLCHAAIVARELQIPCVVGTEFATKFFHDGDMVEVDAINGIIKKL